MGRDRRKALFPRAMSQVNAVDFVPMLARAFGECREGRNTNVPKGHIQLCCVARLMHRQLAAGYLTEAMRRYEGELDEN